MPTVAPLSRLVKFHAPEMLFGLDSLAEAGYAAARLGALRPFLVTDAGLRQTAWVDELVGHFAAVGLRPVIWDDVTPNPKDHEIARGVQRYLETGCDVIVAIGGGSVMDAAKGIAIVSGNGGEILDFAGIDQVVHPIPPLLMIPTTAGTGADVSQFCIVTDTAHAVKVTIMGRAVVPDISVTDPRLLATMPDDLTAATGLDALTHAIESFVSLGHNALSDGHALSAAALIARWLPTAVHHGRDTTAQMRMAQASLEAGLAFSNAILGATHAMSHQVGGLLDAPHGVVNGVLLPHVIRFNAAAVPGRFRPLATAMGLPVANAPDDEVAELLADGVRALADTVGVPRGLAELGVRPGDIDRLAVNTLQDACLSTNPRPASAPEIAALFRAAL